MKTIYFLLLLFSTTVFSQETIETSFVKKELIPQKNFVSIDNFETIYYIQNNIFGASRLLGSIEYSNIELGNITSANTFDPLKINLFYKAFNTVVILDNRLAEIVKIDFNTTQLYKNITHVSTGHDSTIWCFNQDNQELELFDYRTNTTKAKTLPINGNVIQITSNYNTCWLLTENYLYEYNYFGSLLKKVKNDGYTALAENNGILVLKKDNTLFYLKQNAKKATPLILPKLLISRFFVTNESLYIYDDEFLHQYQLINE